MLKLLDLFSGIGGFSLGLERSGYFQTQAFCEIDGFCRKVLAKHWPGVPIYNDVKELTKEKLDSDGITIDAICGGYPCQPFSLSGDRRGAEDDRHLWPEVDRLIRELRPKIFCGENVVGHITLGIDQVLFDLEGQGYTTEVFILPACAVGAEHRRDRVWIVAYSDSAGLQERQGICGVAEEAGGSEFWETSALCAWREPAPDMVRIADGVPGRVDRIRALGNAVVPQIPEMIGRAIKAAAATGGTE